MIDIATIYKPLRCPRRAGGGGGGCFDQEYDMNLSPGTIAAVLDHLGAAIPTRAMSDHQLVLTGYHQALADVRAALARAAELADDDGTIPDYIDIDAVVGARSTP